MLGGYAKQLCLCILTMLIQACGGYIVTNFSVPLIDGVRPDIPLNARIEVEGTGIYVRPVNDVKTSEGFSAFGAINVPYAEKRSLKFDRYYYSTHRALPDFFLIEALIRPGGRQVMLELDAVQLVLEQKSIEPIAIWEAPGAHWSAEQLQKSKQDLFLHGRLCNVYGVDISSVQFQKVSDVQRLILGARTPSCFLLMFPTSPVDPKHRFAIKISRVVIDSKTVELPTINYDLLSFKTNTLLGP